MQTIYTPDKLLARKRFDGSDRLFRACWRAYIAGLRTGTYDTPASQDCIDFALDCEAAHRVNNERSPFYIFG